MQSPNSSPSPPRLQVVFQGGGAKLCVLMAVCDVLRKMNDNKEIEIVRVAGSSAGAIAAVMLASFVTIEAYKERIRKLWNEYSIGFNVPKWFGIWRVVNGSPYFTKLELINFFKDLFTQGTGPKNVQDLKIETRIYFTSLYSLSAQVAPATMSIPKALAKSCRFPFAFSGFASDDDDVDGGLAMNLPVDELKSQEATHGAVIAISFQEEFRNVNRDSLLAYTQQLFSAAVQSGVTRSEMILGTGNVYRAPTDIGTFEFQRALDEGLGYDKFNNQSERFRGWLQTWLRDHGPITPQQIQHAQRFIRPAVTRVPLRPAIINDLDDRLFTGPCTHAELQHMYDTALFDADGRFTGNYRSRSIMRFKILRKTNVLQFSFEIGKKGTFLGANLGCAVTDSNGNSLKFVPHVENIDTYNDENNCYRVYFLFDDPLTPESPGQPYFLEYEYEGDDSYPRLALVPEASSVTQGQGPADEVVIAVAFPRAKFSGAPKQSDIMTLSDDELRRLRYSAEDRRAFVASQPIAVAEVFELISPPCKPEMYFLAGRRAKNVNQHETIGLVVENSAREG